MDFGLSTCVRTRTNNFETYAMTGFTGSLRYMAPEVVRSEAYTEKVDVYSYGLVLYQLITNKLPYDGMKKTTLIEQVIYNNQRPKIKQYIPSPFFNLLTFCWHRDPNERPSFEGIMTELVFLSSQIGVQNNSNVKIDHADGGHIRHVASTDTTSGSLGYAFHAKPALDPIESIQMNHSGAHSKWSISR
jgi:serine/threonine protein kinase